MKGRPVAFVLFDCAVRSDRRQTVNVSTTQEVMQQVCDYFGRQQLDRLAQKVS
jgi:hypothetical protein